MRTGSIRVNQSFFKLEWPKLKEAMDIELVEKITVPTGFVLRCKCDQFDIADDYPEYIFSMSMKGGEFQVVSFENTGRII